MRPSTEARAPSPTPVATPSRAPCAPGGAPASRASAARGLFAVALLAVAASGCGGAADPAASPSIDIAPATARSADPAASADPDPEAPASAAASAQPAPRAAAAPPPAPAAVPAATPTRAPSPSAAAAEALFDEGRRDMSSGNYSAACPKLEKSLTLDFGIGTLLNLATCVEKLGDTARACALYGQAAAETHNQGQLEREKLALARRQSLGCGP
jgi:hypothetical protein